LVVAAAGRREESVWAVRGIASAEESVRGAFIGGYPVGLAARKRVSSMSSCGDPPDTLNVVIVGTRGALFTFKRCKIRGVGQLALTATRCDQTPIGECDRLALLAPGDVALEQLVNRPSADCGIPVSDYFHLTARFRLE